MAPLFPEGAHQSLAPCWRRQLCQFACAKLVFRKVPLPNRSALLEIRSGCGGVVCSVQEIERVKRARPGFVTVVPGVRLADGDNHDQSRVGTPTQVAAAGADVLVIGRLVSAASDRRVAAQEVHAMVADALATQRP